jgi:ferredoxin-fold anticodon binding domain-containing protein
VQKLQQYNNLSREELDEMKKKYALDTRFRGVRSVSKLDGEPEVVKLAILELLEEGLGEVGSQTETESEEMGPRG